MQIRKGQVISIDHQKYTVVNGIEFQEDTWIWQEYEIVDQANIHKWLSIEKNENNQIEYVIYEEYKEHVDTNEIEFYRKDQKYELYERGRAIVKDYMGNADVDKYEDCEYYDYLSQDKKTIISVENWEGEIEKSVGRYLENERVTIEKEIQQLPKSKSKTNKAGDFIAIMIGGVVMSLLAMFCFGTVFSGQKIETYLKEQTTKYQYVTSITHNSKSKKAKVYQSTLGSLDSTVKDIIDGVPEAITKTTDMDASTQTDGIGLQTNNEYAYIYQEAGKVYIQVSSKDYVEGGTTYHSRHSSYYYHTYYSNRNSSIYSNYANSARQRSINSRVSSGGGTSSGK